MDQPSPAPSPSLLRRLAPTLAVAGMYALAACTAARSAQAPAAGRFGVDTVTYTATVSSIPSDSLRQPMVLTAAPVTVGGQQMGIVDVRMTVDTATMLVPQAVVHSREVQV
ncbi:hypothetical protein, partial [Longimicrobium sp.]|uniref:hypothetical protein n=1 Tax=Longimicrobium sp. TaxID=2029185 RepID=UPI002F936223